MNINGRGTVPGQANWAICLGPSQKMADSIGPLGGGAMVYLLKCFFIFFPSKIKCFVANKWNYQCAWIND